jgi:transcriptional regulator with GAF, ATPase, and Fis domain
MTITSSEAANIPSCPSSSKTPQKRDPSISQYTLDHQDMHPWPVDSLPASGLPERRAHCQAAQLLGIDRKTLRTKIQRYGLFKDDASP